MFLLSILFCKECFGQFFSRTPPREPFNRIEFNNFTPNWRMDIFDSTLVRLDTFNGYNSVRNIPLMSGEYVNENKFYRCHAISEYDLLGFIVNCIDISSGDLLWSRIIDTSHFGRQLSPVHQRFDSEGNLVILGFRKTRPFGASGRAWGFAEPSKFFRLVLDKNDGGIISYRSPDENETFQFVATSHNNSWDFFDFNPDGSIDLLFNRRNPFPLSNAYVIKGLINSEGYLIFQDSFEYRQINSGITRSRYAKRGSHYYCLERHQHDTIVYLVEMDSLLNEVDRTIVDYYNYETTVAELNGYDESHLFFVQGYFENEKQFIRLYMYDYSGVLVNLYDLQSDFIEQYTDALRFEYDTKSKQLLIFALLHDRDFENRIVHSFLDVILFDGNEFKLIKSIEISNENRDFFPNWIYFNGEDDLLFDTRAGLIFYRDEPNTLHGFVRSQSDWSYGLMSASRIQLGLETSNVVEQEENRKFLLYPNPNNGVFSITTDKVYDGVNVYNQIGQRMTVSYNGDHIDISHLPTGMYYLYLTERGRRVTETQILIKIE